MDWQRLWPAYWGQKYPTNAAWDKALNRALDENKIKNPCGEYTVQVGEFTVWVGNWPFAYGYCYDVGESSQFLPTVATRKRLRQRIIEDFIESKESENART